MTETEYQDATEAIKLAQRLHRGLQRKLAEKGVQPIDILIAGVFSAYDLAAALHGDGAGAVEWMRDTLDHIEGQAMRRLN